VTAAKPPRTTLLVPCFNTQACAETFLRTQSAEGLSQIYVPLARLDYIETCTENVTYLKIEGYSRLYVAMPVQEFAGLIKRHGYPVMLLDELKTRRPPARKPAL
jgi:hypothetical protein